MLDFNFDNSQEGWLDGTGTEHSSCRMVLPTAGGLVKWVIIGRKNVTSNFKLRMRNCGHKARKKSEKNER